MTKHIPPAINLKSFSCPNCGALADQTRFEDFVDTIDRQNGTPFVMNETNLSRLKKILEEESNPDKRKLFEPHLHYIERKASGTPFVHALESSRYMTSQLENIHISRCFSCEAIAIWKYDSLLYPPARYDIEPNTDLPQDIQADFNEARSVLELSPRSAAALLRQCIQKICIQLGLPGKDLNTDIGALVAKGLDVRVQKALDLVRMIGNSAVHPGKLDLTDDRDTAAKLFELVNRIAFDMITHPKQLDALYEEKVPQSVKDQIARRDTPKQ
jgi:hypothetical protein